MKYWKTSLALLVVLAAGSTGFLLSCGSQTDRSTRDRQSDDAVVDPLSTGGAGELEHEESPSLAQPQLAGKSTTPVVSNTPLEPETPRAPAELFEVRGRCVDYAGRPLKDHWISWTAERSSGSRDVLESSRLLTAGDGEFVVALDLKKTPDLEGVSLRLDQEIGERTGLRWRVRVLVRPEFRGKVLVGDLEPVRH